MLDSVTTRQTARAIPVWDKAPRLEAWLGPSFRLRQQPGRASQCESKLTTYLAAFMPVSW